MTIPIATYKSIADLIDSAQSRGVDISLALFNFREDLDNSEVIDENIDKQWLYIQADTSYLESEDRHNSFNREMLNFIKALQFHVTLEYGSVNSFLRDNSTTVLELFAAMSTFMGYPIDADNIQSASDLC